MIYLKKIDINLVISALPAFVIDRHSMPLIHEAIGTLCSVNLRFSTKTGKVYDNYIGLRSAIHKYKSNPYLVADLDNIIGDMFAPIIAMMCTDLHNIK